MKRGQGSGHGAEDSTNSSQGSARSTSSALRDQKECQGSPGSNSEQLNDAYVVLAERGALVREGAELTSRAIGTAFKDDTVRVVEWRGRRARITEPLRGWISGRTRAGVRIIERQRPWVASLTNCNVSACYQTLINNVHSFHAVFGTGKYSPLFTKLVIPLEELLEVLQRFSPPEDVMVATLSGVIQTAFDELRLSKGGRKNMRQFSNCLVSSEKSLTTFIHALQGGIRQWAVLKSAATRTEPSHYLDQVRFHRS